MPVIEIAVTKTSKLHFLKLKAPHFGPLLSASNHDSFVGGDFVGLAPICANCTVGILCIPVVRLLFFIHEPVATPFARAECEIRPFIRGVVLTIHKLSI